MMKCTAGIPVVKVWPRFINRSPHLVPTSALSASVRRTLSPLEPDVPKIPSFWLSLRWDSHHRINENIRGGRRRREAVQCEKRPQRLCIFASQFSLITDFPLKSCVRPLILLLSLHLFSKSGRDIKLSSSGKTTWHFSFCLAFKNGLWSHMTESGNIKHQNSGGDTKAKTHWPLYVKFHHDESIGGLIHYVYTLHIKCW